MHVSDYLMTAGGLALFLYGMKMMSGGLEAAAGTRLKTLLEKLTSNRILGVLVGAGITMVIQSSSATTVMVVGFVNSGLMGLSQAVWVIMGANIGTTITGQLIALDVGALAPVVALAGVVMVTFFKQKKVVDTGTIIAGLGILFIGMDLMSSSLQPLQNSPAFISMMTKFSNPLLGILAGAVFTAIIQSSSASVGILQALATSGLIGLGSSVYVLFGQNIGTCITAVLASIGTNKNARRSTIIHILFNCIGTAMFVIICMTTPFVSFMQSLTPDNPAAQIANVHTLFNIVTTLLLLPFGQLLAKAACRILPGEDQPDADMAPLHLTEQGMGSTAIAISQLEREVGHMYELACQNLFDGMDSVVAGKAADLKKIEEREEYIDYLNTAITSYIAGVTAENIAARDAAALNALFSVAGNVERMGDHAMNIAQYTQSAKDRGVEFSDGATQEMEIMREVLRRGLEVLPRSFAADRRQGLSAISHAEEKIDEMNRRFRHNQISRLGSHQCSAQACVMYSELLTDVERVGDHLLNIAQACYQHELQLVF